MDPIIERVHSKIRQNRYNTNIPVLLDQDEFRQS